MSLTIELALENVQSTSGGPFGAMIVRGDDVIATGVNRVRINNDPTEHAEIVAIRGACVALGDYQLRGTELYTSCEPCPMCLGAIYWARIDRIFFAASRHDAAAAGFDDAEIYRELEKRFDERDLTTRQLMREEAVEIFRRWRKKPDALPY